MLKLNECSGVEALELYCILKAKNHKRYKTYGKISHIENAINKQMLFLNDGLAWNDTKDREYMSSPSLFGKCFAYGEEESVAMWMLYGSEGGKQGGMLDFSGKFLREIINEGKVLIGVFKDDNYEVIEEVNDAEIWLQDVYYYSKINDSKYRFNHVDEHVIVDLEAVDDSQLIIKKSFSWFYEKECRLLVKLPERCVETIKNNNIHDIAIVWNIPTKEDSFVCYKSPVFEGECADYVKPSKLTGEVDWEI